MNRTTGGDGPAPDLTLREWHWLFALSATAVALAIAWVLIEVPYRLPLLFAIPIVLLTIPGYIAVASGSVLLLLAALVIGGFAHIGDWIFGIGVVAGVLSAIRGRLFIPMSANPLARFVRSRIALSRVCHIVALLFVLDSAYKATPWLANFAVALGYVSLGFYLRTGTVPDFKRAARSALGNAALFVFGIAFAAGILELGSRYLLDIPLPLPPSLDSMQADDASLWAPRPSMRREYESSKIQGRSGPFVVTHSAAGSRGAEVGPKETNEFRIVMIGDSFTYGWGVNDDEHIAARLEQLAASSESRPVTVVNLGVSGYAPWQELARLKKWGMPLKPDLVVLQLFPSNDVPDTLMKLNQVLPAFGPAVVGQVQYWRDHTRWDMRLERTLRASCGVYNAYRELWPKNDSAAEILDTMRFFKRPRESFSPVLESDRTWWMEVMLKNWYPALQAAQDEFEGDVLKIADYCRRNDLPLLVYSIPDSHFSPASWQSLVDKSRDDSGEDVEYEQFKDSRVAEDFFRKSGLPWVPVLDPIRGLPDPEALYIRNDGHFNEQGNKFIATLIFNRLVRDGHLQGPAAQWEPRVPVSGDR